MKIKIIPRKQTDPVNTTTYLGVVIPWGFLVWIHIYLGLGGLIFQLFCGYCMLTNKQLKIYL